MSIIVDGKKIAQEIEDRLKKQVEELKEKNITLKLAVVQVGDNKASSTYVAKKKETADRVGLDFCLHKFSENISQEELIDNLIEIQKEKINGLIVQLPLPDHMSSKIVTNHIDPDFDIDCLTATSWGKLIQEISPFEPPTAGAMMEILKYHKIDLVGKEVVLVGNGKLVGKPLSIMLLKAGSTITVCHNRTIDLASHTRRADIVMSGVGKHNLITGEMIKDGAIVIDAGVAFDSGQMYGDIEFSTVSKKASLVTPTPGGVGPVTVVKLIENTVKSGLSRL